MRNLARWIGSATLVLMVPLATAFAGATVYPSPYSPRIVRFRYNPDQTYVLYLKPGRVTDVQIPSGETLQSLALGDTLQWVTAQSGNNIFIKPVRSGLTTSATIVTDRRTYQVILRSVGKQSKNKVWYQEVTWNSPQIVFPLQAVGDQHSVAPVAKQATDNTAQIGSAAENPMNGVNPTHLDFRYSVRGTAKFRPDRVFDDGHFTWIHIPKAAWVMPALFVREHGVYALVNYDVKGNWLVVQRTFRKAVLRASGQEVTITRILEQG